MEGSSSSTGCDHVHLDSLTRQSCGSATGGNLVFGLQLSVQVR
jgi:hypothetical protein